MSGVERLEHQRHSFVAGLDAQTLRSFAGPRRFMPKRLQKPQHAVAARGDTKKDRAHDAVTKLLREIIKDLVARGLDVLEQLFHEFVVMIGKRLQHCEARFFLAIEIDAFEFDNFRRRMFLVDVGPLKREIDEPGDDVTVPDRNLPQQQRGARSRLQELDSLANALLGLIDLVEEQETWNVLLFQRTQDKLQLRNLFFVRFANDDRGVDRG